MKPRNTYTTDGSGRLFTAAGLEKYRRDLCAELRRVGQGPLAEAYERKTLQAFANQGGYVIVPARRSSCS